MEDRLKYIFCVDDDEDILAVASSPGMCRRL